MDYRRTKNFDETVEEISTSLEGLRRNLDKLIDIGERLNNLIFGMIAKELAGESEGTKLLAHNVILINMYQAIMENKDIDVYTVIADELVKGQKELGKIIEDALRNYDYNVAEDIWLKKKEEKKHDDVIKDEKD